MEVFNFLHLTARRFAALVGVTLVACLVTAFVLVEDSESYEAEVLVFAGQALPTDRSPLLVTPFVGDLDVLLALEPVRSEIAAASGVGESAAVELSTRQVNNGTALSIRATAATPELAETLAAEAARVGLTTLLEQGRDRSRRTVDAAELRLLDARADLAEFRTANDIQDPSADYEAAVGELSSVRIQLLNSELGDDVLDALEARRQELVAEIERLTPLQLEYDGLRRAAVDAEDAVSGAAQELSTNEALLVGAASGDFVVATPAEPVSSRNDVVAGMAATAFVVVVLSVGLFVLIDRRRERRSTSWPFAPDAAPPARDGGVAVPGPAGAGEAEETVDADEAGDEEDEAEETVDADEAGEEQAGDEAEEADQAGDAASDESEESGDGDVDSDEGDAVAHGSPSRSR